MTNKVRKSNFELLRIVSMVMIVSYHYAVHGIQKILDNSSAYAIYLQGSIEHRLFTSFFTPGGAVGVALFFMISGYFLVNSSKVSLHKVVLESLYYAVFSVILVLIFELVGGGTDYSKIGIAAASLENIFTPVTNGNWWFITVYLFLILMSPVINKFLNRLNERGFILFVIFAWAIWYCFPMAFEYQYLNIQKAIFFYIVGAWMRKLKPLNISTRVLIFVSAFLWSVYSTLDDAQSRTTLQGTSPH